MSRLFEHFGDPDANRGAGWLALIAHAMMPATIALAAVDFARMVVPWLVPRILLVAASAAMFLCWFVAGLHVHLARLCVRCMREVPADAPVRAERFRWALRFHHEAFRLRALLVWLLILLALALLRQHLYTPEELAAGAGEWADLVIDVYLLAAGSALWFHHRHRPWCPYCPRWDDGDDEREEIPTPDPAGANHT